MAVRGVGSEPSAALARFATALCLSGTFVFIVLLGFALYRFRFGLSRPAVAWYALAIAGILVTLFVAKSPAGIRLTLSITGVSLAIAVVGFEIGLEFIERTDFVRIQQAVERRTGTPFDRRTIREVVTDLRSEGIPAVPSVVPRVLLPYVDAQVSPESEFRARFLPLAGVSRRPTVQLCVEGGRYPVYQSDEYGFHNPEESWISAPDLVALIGDSFTHGYCVPSDSTIAANLRRTWPRLLNLGTGGSGPLAELATLTEYAAPMKPRLVLWMYSENDLSDLAVERGNPTLRRYLENGYCQGLKLRQAEIDSVVLPWVDRLYSARAEARAWGVYGWRQTLTLVALRKRLSGSAGESDNAMIQLPIFEQILRTAKERVSGWGGRIVVVFLPAWERLFDPAIARSEQTREGVLDVAHRLDIPILDLTPVFGPHPESLYSRGSIASGHYSAAGYALVARSILDTLSRYLTEVKRVGPEAAIDRDVAKSRCDTVSPLPPTPAQQ